MDLETQSPGAEVDHRLGGQDQGERHNVPMDGQRWVRAREHYEHPDYADANHLCHAGRADERHNYISESC